MGNESSQPMERNGPCWINHKNSFKYSNPTIAAWLLTTACKWQQFHQRSFTFLTWDISSMLLRTYLTRYFLAYEKSFPPCWRACEREMTTNAAQEPSTTDDWLEAISILLLQKGFLIPMTTNDCTGSNGLWLELHRTVWNKHYLWQISCNLMSQTWAFIRKSKKPKLRKCCLGFALVSASVQWDTFAIDVCFRFFCALRERRFIAGCVAAWSILGL